MSNDSYLQQRDSVRNAISRLKDESYDSDFDEGCAIEDILDIIHDEFNVTCVVEED